MKLRLAPIIAVIGAGMAVIVWSVTLCVVESVTAQNVYQESQETMRADNEAWTRRKDRRQAEQFTKLLKAYNDLAQTVERVVTVTQACERAHCGE